MLHMLHLSRTIHFWLELFIRQLEEASSKRSQMDVPSHTMIGLMALATQPSNVIQDRFSGRHQYIHRMRGSEVQR